MLDTASLPNIEKRGYAICTSGRSGSNWLCMLLASTGHLGYPREYFNVKGRRLLDDPNYPSEPAQQFERILTMGATPNGIYGVKLFPHHHDAFSQSLSWMELLPNLKLIWLQRLDVLGQALSAARSIQTGQFRSTLQPSGAALYDPTLIRERLTSVIKEQARWSLFFSRTGLQPLKITYEDIAANPQSVVDQVCELLEFKNPFKINFDLVDLQPQRDATTEEWRNRFVKEHGNTNVLDIL